MKNDDDDGLMGTGNSSKIQENIGLSQTLPTAVEYGDDDVDMEPLALPDLQDAGKNQENSQQNQANSELSKVN